MHMAQRGVRHYSLWIPPPEVCTSSPASQGKQPRPGNQQPAGSDRKGGGWYFITSVSWSTSTGIQRLHDFWGGKEKSCTASCQALQVSWSLRSKLLHEADAAARYMPHTCRPGSTPMFGYYQKKNIDHEHRSWACSPFAEAFLPPYVLPGIKFPIQVNLGLYHKNMHMHPKHLLAPTNPHIWSALHRSHMCCYTINRNGKLAAILLTCKCQVCR